MLILKTHARSHLEWSTLEHNELCLNTDQLHFTSHTFEGNHLVECVDFSDLSSATVGRATTQLGRFPLCGTTAAELHNSVDLLCGTTAAELLYNSVDLLCVAQRPPSYTTR